MAIHFSDIGFKLDEYDYIDELTEFIEENTENTDKISAGDEHYLVVSVDDTVEMWFHSVYGETDIACVEPHYRSGMYYEAAGAGWVYIEDERMTGLLKVMLDGYPLNLNVSSAACLPEFEAGAPCTCEISCFAETYSVYDDLEDFTENNDYGDIYKPQDVIPVGCYEKFGNDEVAETSRAIITGIVKEVEVKVNGYTGNEFYLVKIESLNNSFALLIDPELADYEPPEAGNVVMGRFWLTGKVIKI